MTPSVSYSNLSHGMRGVRLSTVPAMQAAVAEAVLDPYVRGWAERIVNGTRGSDSLAEARAIYTWVLAHVQYRQDPEVYGVDGIELVKKPALILKQVEEQGWSAGDCDDHATLICALCSTIGIPVVIVVVGENIDDPEHVYAALVQRDPPKDQRDLLALDTGNTNPAFAKHPPSYLKATIFAAGPQEGFSMIGNFAGVGSFRGLGRIGRMDPRRLGRMDPRRLGRLGVNYDAYGTSDISPEEFMAAGASPDQAWSLSQASDSSTFDVYNEGSLSASSVRNLQSSGVAETSSQYRADQAASQARWDSVFGFGKAALGAGAALAPGLIQAYGPSALKPVFINALGQQVKPPAPASSIPVVPIMIGLGGLLALKIFKVI